VSIAKVRARQRTGRAAVGGRSGDASYGTGLRVVLRGGVVMARFFHAFG
jgi:hypothetical protein